MLIKARAVVPPPVDGSDVAVCNLPRASDVVAGTGVVAGAVVVAGTVVVVVEDGPTLGSGLPPRETRT